jgi:serine/threonine protein kinase
MEAVEATHAAGIAHRDIKLENCFISKDIELKLADFGLMKFFEGELAQKLSTMCGTVAYMAPEVAGKAKTYKGPPADIFSCGVLLFMMHTAVEPFYQSNDKWHKQIMNNPNKALGNRGIDLSDSDGIDLILKMIEINPEKRITMEEIKAHPWL